MDGNTDVHSTVISDGVDSAMAPLKAIPASSPDLSVLHPSFRARQRLTALSPATAAFLEHKGEDHTGSIHSKADLNCLESPLADDVYEENSSAVETNVTKTLCRTDGLVSPISKPCFDGDDSHHDTESGNDDTGNVPTNFSGEEINPLVKRMLHKCDQELSAVASSLGLPHSQPSIPFMSERQQLRMLQRMEEEKEKEKESIDAIDSQRSRSKEFLKSKSKSKDNNTKVKFNTMTFVDVDQTNWSADRISAWQCVDSDPGAYYYKYKGPLLPHLINMSTCDLDWIKLAIDDNEKEWSLSEPRRSPWSTEEHLAFLMLLSDPSKEPCLTFTKSQDWGLLSCYHPTRTGQQLELHYHECVSMGMIGDKHVNQQKPSSHKRLNETSIDVSGVTKRQKLVTITPDSGSNDVNVSILTPNGISNVSNIPSTTFEENGIRIVSSQLPVNRIEDRIGMFRMPKKFYATCARLGVKYPEDSRSPVKITRRSAKESSLMVSPTYRLLLDLSLVLNGAVEDFGVQGSSIDTSLSALFLSQVEERRQLGQLFSLQYLRIKEWFDSSVRFLCDGDWNNGGMDWSFLDACQQLPVCSGMNDHKNGDGCASNITQSPKSKSSPNEKSSPNRKTSNKSLKSALLELEARFDEVVDDILATQTIESDSLHCLQSWQLKRSILRNSMIDSSVNHEEVPSVPVRFPYKLEKN